MTDRDYASKEWLRKAQSPIDEIVPVRMSLIIAFALGVLLTYLVLGWRLL